MTDRPGDPPRVEPAFPANAAELVARALAEDVGDGDVTAEATVPADARGRAAIVQKAPGAIYGLGYAEEAQSMRERLLRDFPESEQARLVREISIAARP